MFVAAGAKEKIRHKGKERFITESLTGILEEAKRLGITKQELIEMIQKM